MVAITPRKYKANMLLINGSEPQPKARIPQFMYLTHGKGIPRYEDLISIRILEETHTVSLPIDTIIQQITTTPFCIKPTVDDPTDAHMDVCDQIMYFLDGHFNQNKESWDHLMKMLVRDILSIDAGIVEKVPEEINGEYYLGEIYARNGAVFTKNLDKWGRFPQPPEVAYYQFSMPSVYLPYSRDMKVSDLTDLNQELAGGMYYGAMAGITPIPFTSDQIAWCEENPRTWNIYGQGRVQKVKNLVEIILNQDLSNKKYFAHNEIPEGIMNLIGVNQQAVDRTREYWRDQIQGKPHKLPIIGGEVSYTPFRPSPRELDFVSSQQWFNKLVWMCFGLNQNEVGDLADVNRSTAKEQSATIYRRTTIPLLNFIAQMINTEILPYMKEYHEVDGEVEFAFIPYNYEADSIKKEQELNDLRHDITTINEIRIARGEDPFAWGDIPMSLAQQMIRSHPEWFYEHFVQEHDPDLPEAPDPISMPFMSYGSKKDPDPGCDNFFQRSEQEKDALRNQRGGDFPPLVEHMREMQKAVANEIYDQVMAIEDDLDDYFPDHPQDPDAEDVEPEELSYRSKQAYWHHLDGLIDRIVLHEGLTRIAVGFNRGAMERGVDYELGKLQSKLEDFVGDPIDLEARFNVKDTFAYQRMEEKAGIHMRHVDHTIKEQVRNTLVQVADEGGTVMDAKNMLMDRVDGMTRHHAELVARTETLSASRDGTQALCEGTDLISHKRWISSEDGRERTWHMVMHDAVVPKEEPFIVPQIPKGQLKEGETQPPDYPREAFVVGEDQPYNCRCSQQPILRAEAEEMDLKNYDDGWIKIKILGKEDLLLREHGKDGEDFEQMIKRMDQENSRSENARILGVSKPTLYKYIKRADLM